MTVGEEVEGVLLRLGLAMAARAREGISVEYSLSTSCVWRGCSSAQAG
jgi:hypothetical protein